MRYLLIVNFLIGVIVYPGSVAIAQRRNLQRFSIPEDWRVTAEIDRGVQQAMIEAQQAIKAGKYLPAIGRLQSILDYQEDFFLSRDFKGKNAQMPGVKAQTQRIISNLPQEGRTAYELQFGATARALLSDAMLTNNLEKVADVAGRYQMTAAGFEAMQILIASAFDHDQLIEAAMLCEQLASRPKIDEQLTGKLLLRAAFAWHLAGQADRSRFALNSLTALKAPALWRIGGQQVAPFQEDRDATEWLTAQFGGSIQPPTQVVQNWNLPRGGPTGNESATAACPAGGGTWHISPLKYARIHMDDEANELHKEVFEQLALQIEKLLRDDNRLTQPAAVPVVVGDTVVFRTLNDVTAVDKRNGELLWRSSVTDGMISWLLQSPSANAENATASSPTTFAGYLRHKLYRDQLSNSLTSDGQNVYAIEEADSQFNALRPRIRQQFGLPYVMNAANKLVAYDLKGGRLLWEIGGIRGTPPAELSGIFFLGPPLPFQGRLYCLVEMKDEVRLMALVPEATSARLEWSQTLISISDSDLIASARRLAGIIPVVSDGVMICPTASGSVVAFDLVQRQLRWGYSYEALKGRVIQDGLEYVSPFQIDEEEARWLDGGPLLAAGRIVITPRDSTELHCLNLIDGTLVWKRPREQGLYVALISDDRVVVVGRTQIMAYSLADGSEAWSEPLEIPEPSGRGIREGSRYLLPLSTGEIATVDLSNGRILGRARLPENSIPGNLAIAGGALISCGTHDVIGFQALAEVEQQIARKLKENPKNAEALALRGELRLHRGEEENAINDLRESLREKSDPRVKRVLAGTMLALMKNDSARLLKAVSELESLTDDPRQRIEFLHLYAAALDAAGDRVGAVTQLFRLSTTPELTEGPVVRSPGYFISVEQSIRSQLFTIYQSATGNQRQEIEKVFARQFENAFASSDREASLERFMNLTVGHPAADPLLRHLAESNEIADADARFRLFERLTQSRSQSIAAFSIATLAAKSLAENSPQQALPWINELNHDYPSVTCLNGKTGRQLSEQWLARDDVRRSMVARATWPEGKIEFERTRKRIAPAAFPIDVVTHIGPHFVDWTFEFDPTSGLTARDPSLHIAWQLPLPNFSENSRVQSAQMHIRGRNLAFSAGMSLVVMKSTDPNSSPKISFEKSLRPNSLIDRRSNMILADRHLLSNGRRFQSAYDIRGSAGFLIGLSNDEVFYQLDNRLIAAHAETGQVLWYRIGPDYSKSNATVDTKLVLHTASNEALVLSPMDGAIEQRHKGSLDEFPIWFRGTRRLSQRADGSDLQILEMRDFDGDKVVWQNQYPSGSLANVIDANELAILEPSGKLSILRMATGEMLMATQSPIERPHGTGGVLSVQPFHEQYVVVGGVPAKKSETRTVMTLEFGPSTDSSFTVDGFAFCMGRRDGKIAWSVPVDQLAFDFSQPAVFPVLVLAARHIEYDKLGKYQLMPEISVLVLDKRSGETVFKTEDSMMTISRGPQLVPMIDDHKLIVDVQAWALELAFPAEKKVAK